MNRNPPPIKAKRQREEPQPLSLDIPHDAILEEVIGLVGPTYITSAARFWKLLTVGQKLIPPNPPISLKEVLERMLTYPSSRFIIPNKPLVDKLVHGMRTRDTENAIDNIYEEVYKQWSVDSIFKKGTQECEDAYIQYCDWELALLGGIRDVLYRIRRTAHLYGNANHRQLYAQYRRSGWHSDLADVLVIMGEDVVDKIRQIGDMANPKTTTRYTWHDFCTNMAEISNRLSTLLRQEQYRRERADDHNASMSITRPPISTARLTPLHIQDEETRMDPPSDSDE